MIINNTIYTLKDLKKWRTSESPSLGIIGCPIHHSLSHIMHNTALAVLRKHHPQFALWNYYRLHITPEELPEALELFYQNNFIGLNITTPHKSAVIPLLKTIDTDAKSMNSVNTLIRTDSGYHGLSTDNYGLKKALQEALNTELENADVILIGAGGAAKAAAFLTLQSKAKSLWILNRTARNLRQLIATLPDSPDTAIHSSNLQDIPKNIPSTGILIHATTLGLQPNDPLPIDLSFFDSSLKIFDMIYNPPETPLLLAAKASNMLCANGLSMLVHQGAQALRTWTQLPEVPVDAMYAAVNNVLNPLLLCH